MNKVAFQDWGKIPYQEAWSRQTALHEAVKNRKLQNRNREREGLNALEQQHYLIFCEHPPVYTLGKSGSMDHLLLGEEELEKGEFEFFKINRGGDITYHGPGQIVGYPIFDLDCFFTDVHKYVRLLEEGVIRMLADFGIDSYREQGYTGVWLPAKGQQAKRKICAIGVHLSRWVTMHGFALNVNPELDHFSNIVPCGIADKDKEVSSMAKELGALQDVEEVKNRLKVHFADLFGFQFLQN